MTLSHCNQPVEYLSKYRAIVPEGSLSPFCKASNSWRDKAGVASPLVRRLAFNFAMLFGSIGFVLYGNLACSSLARGELITSVGTQEAAKSRGAQQTAQFGGNAVYVRADYEFPGFGTITNYFSGFLVDQYTLGAAAHTFDSLSQYNPRYWVGLSSDYRSPTIEIPIKSFEFHPSYAQGVTGSGYDLTRGLLEYAAPGVSEIKFWTGSRPDFGTDVLKVGYGVSGTPAGYDFADQGSARGVYSTVSDFNSSLGDPSRYIVSQTDQNRADGGRAASKDSGGPGFIWNPASLRYEMAFMQIGGHPAPSVPFTELLYIDSEARSFLTYSSVPEPSSAALLFTSIGIYAIHRRRKKRQISASGPQAVTTSRP